MNKTINRLLALLIVSLYTLSVFAQNNTSNSVLTGKIIDADSKKPLAFANIGFHNSKNGSISNAEGYFSIPLPTNTMGDSLRVEYIGYASYQKALPLSTDTLMLISLQSKSIELQEAMVYAEMPSVENILKLLIERLPQNYKAQDAKTQLFYRQEHTADLPFLSVQLKKNDIPEIDQKTLSQAFAKIPRHSTSFSDLLCNTYISNNTNDSLKIDPLRFVRLKDVEIAEVESLGSVFNKLLKQTKGNEYWKIRSGILGQKIEIDTSGIQHDKDSTINLKFNKQALESSLAAAHISDNHSWEFIFKPQCYNYSLEGVVTINNETAFFITFTPQKRGSFAGNMYISTNTYALLRADYRYSSADKGTHINLLGISYNDEAMETSVMYVLHKQHYRLKFLSRLHEYNAGVDRDITMLKKRRRSLFDKTIFKTKTALKLTTKIKEKHTILAFDYDIITPLQYKNAPSTNRTKVIEIKQYDESLWADYPNIAPESQLKTYRKQLKE